jgi:hypothetical protein
MLLAVKIYIMLGMATFCVMSFMPITRAELRHADGLALIRITLILVLIWPLTVATIAAGALAGWRGRK